MMRDTVVMREYRPYAPMSYQEFRELPPDLKKEHISYIIRTFDVRSTQIAEYWYVSPETARRMMKESGCRQKIGRHEWTEENEGRFKEWLGR